MDDSKGIWFIIVWICLFLLTVQKTNSSRNENKVITWSKEIHHLIFQKKSSYSFESKKVEGYFWNCFSKWLNQSCYNFQWYYNILIAKKKRPLISRAKSVVDGGTKYLLRWFTACCRAGLLKISVPSYVDICRHKNVQIGFWLTEFGELMSSPNNGSPEIFVSTYADTHNGPNAFFELTRVTKASSLFFSSSIIDHQTNRPLKPEFRRRWRWWLYPYFLDY